MGIVLFFIIFGVVVIAHEFGHFIIAKANGISVVEFTVGMGPCIFSVKKGGTKYAIRLLPLGGACIFEGEDGIERDTEKKEAESGEADPQQDVQQAVANTELGSKKKPGAFPDAPVFARIATVLAGPVFNFILAFLMSTIIVGRSAGRTAGFGWRRGAACGHAGWRQDPFHERQKDPSVS